MSDEIGNQGTSTSEAEPTLRLTRRGALGASLGLMALATTRVFGQEHHRGHQPTPPPSKPAPKRASSPTAGRPVFRRQGPLPWEEIERRHYPPGVPGRDYKPVFVPNGTKLPYRVVDGVKVFHLTADPIIHELAEGLTVKAFGFNGRTPGPVIEAVAGDRVRVYATNRLPAPTTVHWHGLLVPNGMDGVPGLTQPAIMPGETFKYEFTLPHPGTFMYHPHFDGMTEEGLGMTGMFVVHPRNPKDPAPDRDFAIMLHEWSVHPGTSRPDPNEMTDFNILTMNGRAFPDTEPLVAQRGDRVRIRLGNLSQMSHHPIHLHGHFFWVVGTDGAAIPESARWPETTVLVQVGSTRDIEFIADNPGDWPIHCHMMHHMMNQMGHGIPNMIGVDVGDLDQKIRRLLPGYMTMGQTGMGEMATMKMPVPENTIPMRGLEGPFGPSIFGGMANLLKVRDYPVTYEDPGWYQFPAGTVASAVTDRDLERDGIDPGVVSEAGPVHRH